MSERKKAKKGVTVHTEQCDTAACRFQLEPANPHITLLADPYRHSRAVLLKTENGKGPYLSRLRFTQLDASALGSLQHACSRELRSGAGRVLPVGYYAS